MRPAAFALAVALALPTLAPAATMITETDAVTAVRTLVARVGSYSVRHPDAPGGCAAWAGTDVSPGEPLLIHRYPKLEPSYYYVPLNSATTGSATFVTVDALTGRWQAFGSRSYGGDFPRVSRDAAARSAASALGTAVRPTDLRAVGMPDRHLYWYAGEPGGREAFINIAQADDVHFGPDVSISPPMPYYEPPEEAQENSAHADEPGAPVDVGSGRDVPPSYDIPGVPYHVQIGPDNCGPAAAEMVLDYWGPDIDQDDVADVANCLPISGSWNSDIRRCGHFSSESTAVQNASLHGYNERALGYAALDQWWSLPDTTDNDFPSRYDDLKRLVSEDFPVLLLTRYQVGGNGHFRVVKGYNDSTSVFIVHDPWYSDPYHGPNVNFDQTFLVDTLWADIASRWATLIAPWEVTLDAPEYVEKGEQFTVRASTYYTGPHPFNGQDTAAGPEITIYPSLLFTLAPGETATKTLSGFGFSGIGFGDVTWEVVADTLLLGNIIEVVARGRITDSSHSYVSYSDSIGGKAFQPVTIVDWAGIDGPLPTALRLHSARPSPFEGATSLLLDVPADAGRVTLAIYNVRGQRVRTLCTGTMPRGRREFVWNGEDDNGLAVSAGVYFARCECEMGTRTQKLVLVR